MTSGHHDTDRAAVGAVGMLAISNVMANRVLPPAAYVPWNCAVAAVLLALARRAGVDGGDLGLDRASLPRGLATGAVAAAGIAGVYGALAAGGDHTLLDDRRARDLRPPEAWFHGLVRIPFGTVLVEEVAFRGVVPALLVSPRRPAWFPAVASSVLFGLWHVLPSRDLARANVRAERVASRTGPGGMTALAVVATSVAGGALHALRRRGHHLAAPVLAHVATNVLGLLAARHRRGGP